MQRFELTPEIAREFRDRYGLQYFVETGIGRSDTRAYHLAPLFEHAWAIDVDPENCEIARKRAVEIPNLTIYQGDSGRWLNVICPIGPALYFLDAHWTGSGEQPEVECPLLSELSAIGRTYRGDVVLIDDARQFAGTPTPPHDPAKWPTLEQIRTVVQGWYLTGWRAELLDHGRDVLAIIPTMEPCPVVDRQTKKG